MREISFEEFMLIKHDRDEFMYAYMDERIKTKKLKEKISRLENVIVGLNLDLSKLALDNYNSKD